MLLYFCVHILQLAGVTLQLAGITLQLAGITLHRKKIVIRIHPDTATTGKSNGRPKIKLNYNILKNIFLNF